jgi:GT2 family glycosyltransferase
MRPGRNAGPLSFCHPLLSSAAVNEVAEAQDRPSLSVVVVAHDSAGPLRRSLPAIVSELRGGDELIVCDNASSDETRAVVAELAPAAILIAEDVNAGFGAACNAGAAGARGDLLLFLNPDNVVAPGFRAAIELPWTERRGWGAWQGLVTDGGGARINSRGGVVHFTGIAWAGGAGAPRSAAPAGPQEVAFPSGACLAIRRDTWTELGGFSEPYFLYQEDTDLGLRLQLAGRAVGIEPRAVSDHEYDFDKGAAKWRYLERNRWATIIRTYPGRLLALLVPGLLATELALLVVAAAGGWLPQKLGANFEVLRALPRLRSERRLIQTAARIDAAGFASRLVPGLDSAFLGRAADSRILAGLLAAYWRLVLRLL